MSDHGAKNLPRPNRDTQPFWDGCRRGELLLQRCRDCGEHQFYPRMMCCHCNSDGIEWVPASGRGKVSSYTVVRRPVSQAYAAETPYVVALVTLAEGPTMMSNVIDCEPGALAVGMTVGVVFETWSPEITIPKFRPLAREV